MRELESFDTQPAMASKRHETVECRAALSRSRLPGLDHALNPYVGCAHDCAYCYAPYVVGVDRGRWAEARVKDHFASLLAKELCRPKGTIGVGTVTDPYQPLERETELTRRCLELMIAKKASFSILTKSDLVLRDVDLIKRSGAAEVGITVTTIDEEVARVVEPHAPSPSRRLEAARRLVENGISTYVLIGPAIPTITNRNTAGLIDAVVRTGVRRIMSDRLRLRPGMLDRLGAAVVPVRPGREFETIVGSSAGLAKAVRDVEAAARERGLEVESAF